VFQNTLLFFLIIAILLKVNVVEKNEHLQNIGRNITSKRKSMGLTTKELGFRCDIEKSNLIAIEKGRKNITVTTLLKIATALNVEVKDLLTFSN